MKRKWATAALTAGITVSALVAVPAPAIAADHCTGFCVDVYNGTSKGVWMYGNVGGRWVPPRTWSDDAHPEMEDVDEVEVPYQCTLTYLGTTYTYGQRIRIRGTQPYVWISGC